MSCTSSTVPLHPVPPSTGLTLHLLDLTAIDRADRRRVSRLLLCRVLGTPVTAARLGRPLAPGERVDTAAASVAHDSGVLVVAHHAAGSGVDVEDVDPALLAEVAPRFCGAGERAMDLRATWAVKESVAKSLGLGLAAGLRTVTVDGDPGTGWVPALRHGRALGRLTRVVATAQRHLAVTVVAATPPPVTLRCWAAAGGAVHQVPAAGGPVAALLPQCAGALGAGALGAGVLDAGAVGRADAA